MGMLMGAPSAPAPQPPPPAPVDDSAALAKQNAAAEEQRKRGNSGRAATILTSPLGDTSSAPSASKTLLGY